MRFSPGCNCCGGSTVTVACESGAIPATLTVTCSGGTGGYAGLNGVTFTITFINDVTSAGTVGYWWGTDPSYSAGSGTCCVSFYLMCGTDTDPNMYYNTNPTPPGTPCPSPSTAGGIAGTLVSLSPFHWTHTFTAPVSGTYCGVAIAAGDTITYDVTV